MMRFPEGKSNRSTISAIAIVCAIFSTVCVTWLLGRQGLRRREAAIDVRVQQEADAMPAVSLEDIAHLPANPTYNDVAKLLKGWTFADNLMYKCPAKEGGLYFFSFFPTREVALPEAKGKQDALTLVAVIRFPSEDMLFKGQGGEYVYPARVAGTKFSGFSPIIPANGGSRNGDAAPMGPPVKRGL